MFLIPNKLEQLEKHAGKVRKNTLPIQFLGQKSTFGRQYKMKEKNTFCVINFGTVIPILGFLGLGVLDHFGGQNVPIFVNGSFLCAFVINKNFIGAIRVDNKSIQMSKNIVFASDFFGD